jgi:hypothetical protein
MTAAFDEFMRQHRMTGSEKADGYSPSVFVDLSEEEKPIVLSLLLQELPWSADWIWVVAPDKAEIVLKSGLRHGAEILTDMFIWPSKVWSDTPETYATSSKWSRTIQAITTK